MENNIDKGLTENLHFRFGQTAVDKGFVTSEHLKKALDEQIANCIPSGKFGQLAVIPKLWNV